MKYTVRKSVIRILGEIWLPYGMKAASEITLSDHDLRNIEQPITRETVESWLHVGDFSRIIDFEADLEIGEETVLIPWANEENELAYQDCMYPDPDSE